MRFLGRGQLSLVFYDFEVRAQPIGVGLEGTHFWSSLKGGTLIFMEGELVVEPTSMKRTK